MPRTTWVLLVLALALGAYVYFGEVRGEARREAAEKSARRLVELAADDLRSIALTASSGEAVRLERGESGWRGVAPLEFAVDPFTMDRLADGVADLESKSEIEGAGEPALYGLDDSARRIEVSAKDGPPVELRLGKTVPVGSARYAQSSARPGKVFTVESFAISPLEPSLLDLRDKRLVKTDPDAATRLVVRFPAESRSIALAREGDEWKLVEPIAARADGEHVERLIDDLALARASAFVDQPGAAAEYGLEPPAAEIEITSASGSEQLALGKAGDKAHARLAGVTSVLEIPERIVDGVPSDVFAYRFKRVLALENDAIETLELAFPREQTTHRFTRDDQSWKPEDESLPVDSLELADLVFAIEALDATGIEEGEPDLARLGLAPPRVRVGVRSKAGEELAWLELGDPDPERGLVARSSAGPEVWRVENRLGEDVPLGLDAFRNRFTRKPAEPGPSELPPEAPPAPGAPEPAD